MADIRINIVPETIFDILSIFFILFIFPPDNIPKLKRKIWNTHTNSEKTNSLKLNIEEVIPTPIESKERAIPR